MPQILNILLTTVAPIVLIAGLYLGVADMILSLVAVSSLVVRLSKSSVILSSLNPYFEINISFTEIASFTAPSRLNQFPLNDFEGISSSEG